MTASHWLASKHAEYLRGDGVKGAKADQTAELICQSLRAGFGKAPHRVELFLVPVHAKSGAVVFPYLPNIKPSALELSNQRNMSQMSDMAQLVELKHLPGAI